MWDTESTPMLTVSEVMEHVFCPRFSYFMHCLGIQQHEETRAKVQLGRQAHQRRDRENRSYLRKGIAATAKHLNVYLASPELRVRGVVDEILELDHGTMAPLDYKLAPYRARAFRTHAVQITLYGMLVEATYRKPVHKGFVAYIRDSRKLVEVSIDKKRRDEALAIIAEIFDICRTGIFPGPAATRERCVDCCYRNICPGR